MKNWTEEELILTLGYYLFEKNPNSKINLENFSIKLFNKTGIKRTFGSIGMRVANYIYVDPNDDAKGLSGGKNQVLPIWEEYVTTDPKLEKISVIYQNFINEIELKIEKEFYDTETLDFVNISKKHTNISYFDRSQKVKKVSLERANGICELCGSKAPFYDKNDQPYLEVHHVKFLSDDGIDDTSNTLALCPNCHMKIHYGKELTEKEMKIINAVLTNLVKF